MFPTLFEFQGAGFHTWGLMVMTAFVVTCGLLSFRVGKVGIDSDKLLPFYMVITLGGLLGSRFLHFLMAEPREFFAHPGAFFDLQQGGFAFYGGAIASTVGGAWVGKIMGFDVWKFADTCAPLIMLGLAIGRWGCFFAGCCHGGVVPGATVEHVLLAMPGGDVVSVQGFPWLALEFKRHIGVGSIFDQPLYPTQLWESAGGFALFLGLSWLWRRGRRFDGQVMATLLLTYPILRSTIEMYRGDTLRGTGWFGFLSTSQVVSVGVLALGAGLWLSRMGKGLAPEQEFTPPEDDAVEPA